MIKTSFKGQQADWKSGQLVLVKSHEYTARNCTEEKICGKTAALENAIMLIRNPYDAILSNYNRAMGNLHAGGTHKTKTHVGKVLGHIKKFLIHFAQLL